MRETNRLVTLGLLVALVAVFVLSIVMGSRANHGAEETFVGSDSAATKVAEEHGAEPWFTPIFEPGSSEVESGLFALQAALGAGLLGFALGRLSARRRSLDAVPAAPADHPGVT